MNKFTFIAVLLLSAPVFSADTDVFLIGSKQVSKVQAIKALANGTSDKVVRCQEIELKENKASLGFRTKRKKK